jgi:beta-lactamase superfamily II metal-dependent hydrolase
VKNTSFEKRILLFLQTRLEIRVRNCYNELISEREVGFLTKRVLCVLFSLLLLLSCTSCKSEEAPDSAVFRFQDVGQGDATLLRTDAGDILIDAGTDHAQESLCLHLEHLGVERLLLAIFTHSDEDHVGGADGILRRFPAESVWIGDSFADTECTRLLLSAAAETGATVECVSAGEVRRFGDLILSVLFPLPRTSEGTVNDLGLVLKITYGDVSALFMGDASSETERALLAHYDRTVLRADLLKVGHHGASTSSSEPFLRAVQPKYALISCARGNSYGHPHGETLARLEAVGATVLRVDLSGEIEVRTDGKALWSVTP